MPGHRWTQEELADLARLYPDPAVSRGALEQHFNRKMETIKTIARSRGIYRRRQRSLGSRPWTEIEEQLLRELYPDLANSRQEIARRLNRTWRSIQHRIGQLGIKDTRERNNPCQVRRDYFRTIDSDEKAYWLGFIAADGCVYIGGRQHTLSIQLQRRDRHWLERFRDIIAPNATITDNAGPHSSALSIGSQKLVHDLVALGITPRKSNTLEWPKVPELFVMPFLLGYYDGDGSLQIRTDRYGGCRWTLIGTEQFLVCARNYIQLHTGIPMREPVRANKQCSPHLYRIHAYNQHAVTLYRALNACGLGLPRKHLALTETAR